jgi:hypothetical protein
MAVDWKDYIVSDPEILRGKPCVKGTRIPVSLVLGYLAKEVLSHLMLRLLAYLSLQPEMEHYHGKLLVVEVDRIRIRQ